MFEPKQIEKIKTWMTEGQPFAVFRLPGSDSILFDGQDGYTLRVNDYDRLFAFAAKVEEYISSYKIRLSELATSESAYLNSVSDLITKLQEKSYEKTVLSRVITGRTEVGHVIEAAESLFVSNPDAFCLFMQTADRKLWLMATPELLLETSGKTFYTMALAGTRPLQKNEKAWDAKNRAEQEVVSRYIANVLTDLGLVFTSSSPYTLKSNNVEHICTEFKGHLNGTVGVENLINALSPTPAVCGYPIVEAKNRINRYEKHHRGFYTGYTVVTSPDGNLRVYVNLRCACIDVATGEYAIFVGGGITTDSEPQSELTETNLKAMPLQTIFAGRPVEANL